VTAISIRERVNRDQAMVEPHRNLIRWKCLVLDPITNVAQQASKLYANTVSLNTDVALRRSELAGPLPYVSEHLPVQCSHEVFAEHSLSSDTRRRPAPKLHP
jgi:hypothetical protein